MKTSVLRRSALIHKRTLKLRKVCRLRLSEPVAYVPRKLPSHQPQSCYTEMLLVCTVITWLYTVSYVLDNTTEPSQATS